MTTNIIDIYTSLDKIGYSLFSYDNSDLQDNVWQKKITLYGIDIRLFLEFNNWNYLALPSIYIPSKDIDKLSKKFPQIMFPLPHFSLVGIKEWSNEHMYGFCYALHDRIELPRHQFYIMIKYIEEQCLKVLSIFLNQDSFRREVNKEFYNIWKSFAIYTSFVYQDFYKIDDIFSSLFIQAKIPDDINQIYEANFSLLSPNNESYSWKIFKTKVLFIKISDDRRIPQLNIFFPNPFRIYLSQVLLFLKKWSIKAYDLFLDVLKANIGDNILDGDYLSLCFTYRNYAYAINIKWENKYFNYLQSNQLQHKLLNTSVLCSIVEFLDMDSIINRNIKKIQSNTLQDMKVMQVGVGAIGGYLADGLSKIGAGVSENNDNHKLLLVDKDTFSVDNLGRHILGYNYLSQPKTSAMKRYIENQYGKNFPNIVSIESSIDLLSDNQINKQNNLNLIIDATGSLEVAEYLNEQVLSTPPSQRPHILHLWIYGNGECVQGLWVDPIIRENFGGCINCLHLSGYEKNDPILTPLKDIDFQKIIIEGPCAAYTPYAVSAGMNAASLGIDMILEWLNTGVVKMNYQTRYNSAYNGDKISNMELRRQSRCPHCNKFAK